VWGYVLGIIEIKKTGGLIKICGEPR